MRKALCSVRVVLMAALFVGWTGLAEAQLARASGIVKDAAGQPIKGATIRADNPDAPLSSLTAATDDKGRFAIIGLARGIWTFTAEAPGFVPQFSELNIQRTSTPYPPLTFSLQKAVARPPAGIEGLTAKELQQQLSAAAALFSQSKFEEAIGLYRSILNSAPSMAVVNLQIGAAYRSLKQYDRALAAYEALLAAEPGNERAAIGAATTLQEKGDEPAAEQVLRRAAGTSTGRDVFYALAEIEARKHQTEEAARWYQKASEADPSWGKPLYQLGTMALAKGDRQTAMTTLARVLVVDPTSPEAVQAKAALDALR